MLFFDTYITLGFGDCGSFSGVPDRLTSAPDFVLCSVRGTVSRITSSDRTPELIRRSVK